MYVSFSKLKDMSSPSEVVRNVDMIGALNKAELKWQQIQPRALLHGLFHFSLMQHGGLGLGIATIS